MLQEVFRMITKTCLCLLVDFPAQRDHTAQNSTSAPPPAKNTLPSAVTQTVLAFTVVQRLE